MYTQCPACRTQFRINAEQLAQARGQVRCGVCNVCFNALEALSETPIPIAAPPLAIANTAEAVEGMASHAGDAGPAPEAEPPGVTIAEPPAVTPAEETVASAPHKAAPVWQGPVTFNETLREAVIHTARPQAVEMESIHASAAAERAGEALTAQPAHDLPDLGIMAAEPRPVAVETEPSGWLKTALWAVANILLIVTLLGQYGYFKRDELVQYPELRPWLTRMCAAFGCDTPLQRDVSRITLVNRIVGSHPRHANALLIDATLVNEADFPQPFPLLEIRFSDLDNQLIAGRRFRPGEYLAPGTSLKAGMAPHQPLHVILEIVDPGKDAVSFQFDLL